MIKDIAVSVALVLVAYFIAFPSSSWIGLWLTDEDVKDHGSENRGSTNLSRLLEARGVRYARLWAVFAGFIDVTKGAIPLIGAYFLLSDQFLYWAGILGFIVVVGNRFPVFVPDRYFEGGKCVATGGGAMTMFLAIALLEHFQWWTALSIIPILAIAITIFILRGRKWMVFASLMLIALLVILFAIVGFQYRDFRIFSLTTGAMALLIIYAHRPNLRQASKEANMPDPKEAVSRAKSFTKAVLCAIGLLE